MTALHFHSLSRGMRSYVGVIVIVGAATIIQSLSDILQDPKEWEWTLLAILTLVSGSATVRLPGLPATISVSETFVVTAVLLYGPAAGTLIVALDALIISFWAYKKGDPGYKIIFNVCALPLTIWLAAHLFFLLAGIQPLTSSPDSVAIRNLLAPLFIFTIAYFLLNSWIITFAIALEKGLAPIKIWRENFVALSVNYFGGASVAALLVSYTRNLDLTYLAIIVPLLVVLYLTFSVSMGRVADANRHLTQLNSLYMSTIETLAMAIDAKDQVTHGHIRRVQTYALALAKEMGGSDETFIRAVEAAALLHDMGKLAVPEYILNKPGPLTPAEFEKMKLHASVGADILSAIDFPYPVVPIVRHHHESWNGSGYPDGIAGSAIPLGARILSVVDCFDALTSDRPYRPRLSDKDAIRILLERRGTMYDPLVVDTFIRLQPTIAEPAPIHRDHPMFAATGPAAASEALDHSVGFEEITASASEVVALFGIARALSGDQTVTDVGHITLDHLRRLVPHAFGVLFVYVEATDELTAAYASGDSSSLLTGMRVAVGQRLTGWVAASRQTIRNSDPILDLGETAKTLSPRPRSCLSTALTLSGNLAGVLTIYSVESNAFSEEHERLIEAVAREVSPAVLRAMPKQVDAAASSSGLSKQLVNPEPSGRLANGTCLALIKLEKLGRDASTDRADQLMVLLTPHLRQKDFVFKRGPHEVLILSESSEKPSLAATISRALAGHFVAAVAVAQSPQDGQDLVQLLNAADRFLRGQDIANPAARPQIH